MIAERPAERPEVAAEILAPSLFAQFKASMKECNQNPAPNRKRHREQQGVSIPDEKVGAWLEGTYRTLISGGVSREARNELCKITKHNLEPILKRLDPRMELPGSAVQLSTFANRRLDPDGYATCKFEKVFYCANGCILYRGEHVDKTACHKCGTRRSSDVFFFYRSVLRHISQLLEAHPDAMKVSEPGENDTLNDIYDGTLWKDFYDECGKAGEYNQVIYFLIITIYCDILL